MAQDKAAQQAIVQRMIDAGESEENIAEVIRHFKTTQPTEEPAKSLSGFAGNIASSGAKTVGSIVSGVANAFNPDMQQNTIANLGRLGLGAIEKIIPGRQSHEPYAESVGRFYKDRYGSLDKLKETAYTDPVGLAMDAASVLSGGAGAATKAAGLADVAKAAGTASALRRVSSLASKVSSAVDAPSALLRGFGKGVSTGSERVANKIADIGLGQTGKMHAEFPNAGATMVKEGVVTMRGLRKRLNDAEGGVQSSLLSANPRFDTNRIAAQAEKAASGKFANDPVSSPSIQRVQDLATAYRAERPTGEVGGIAALKGKRAAEGRAESALDRRRKTGYAATPDDEFDMAIADEYRRAIKGVPGVAPALEREQNLVGLKEAMKYATNRPRALSRYLEMGSAMSGFASGHPIAGLGTAAGIELMHTPWFMGGTGIALDRTGKLIGSVAKGMAGIDPKVRAAIIANLASSHGKE